MGSVTANLNQTPNWRNPTLDCESSNCKPKQNLFPAKWLLSGILAQVMKAGGYQAFPLNFQMVYQSFPLVSDIE